MVQGGKYDEHRIVRQLPAPNLTGAGDLYLTNHGNVVQVGPFQRGTNSQNYWLHDDGRLTPA